jgi:hypothetical protein
MQVEWTVHKNLPLDHILSHLNPILRLFLICSLQVCLLKLHTIHFYLPVRATYPAHLIHLDVVTQITFDEECTLRSSSVSIFLHPPITSCHLGPNILLSTLFWNDLILCSFLVYRTVGKIMVLFALIFTFLVTRQEDERFCVQWW